MSKDRGQSAGSGPAFLVKSGALQGHTRIGVQRVRSIGLRVFFIRLLFFAFGISLCLRGIFGIGEAFESYIQLNAITDM